MFAHAGGQTARKVRIIRTYAQFFAHAAVVDAPGLGQVAAHRRTHPPCGRLRPDHRQARQSQGVRRLVEVIGQRAGMAVTDIVDTARTLTRGRHAHPDQIMDVDTIGEAAGGGIQYRFAGAQAPLGQAAGTVNTGHAQDNQGHAVAVCPISGDLLGIESASGPVGGGSGRGALVHPRPATVTVHPGGAQVDEPRRQETVQGRDEPAHAGIPTTPGGRRREIINQRAGDRRLGRAGGMIEVERHRRETCGGDGGKSRIAARQAVDLTSPAVPQSSDAPAEFAAPDDDYRAHDRGPPGERLKCGLFTGVIMNQPARAPNFARLTLGASNLTQTQPPAALLLVSTRCPHCATVLEGLNALVKKGRLARLEVVNISVDPAPARELGVRSAPWFRIGELEFTGAHTPVELRRWADVAGTRAGLAQYLAELLKTGQRERALAFTRDHADRLSALLDLIVDPDADITVRLGADSVIEDFKGSALLHDAVPELARMTKHDEPRVRADACHYLSLTGNNAAIPHLRARLDDSNPDVREIAAESISTLTANAEHTA